MTKAIQNFIWSGSILQKKLVQVLWRKCCRPNEEGSLGFRDLSLLNKALLKKFTWRVITVDSDLFSYLRAHFFKSNGDFRYQIKSFIWAGLHPLCQDHREKSC
ncbi:hypothetical protein PanWU01x14_125870 [Parasponia andersonii]|uniref:Uncharacterized protein n=1 Tax=Parasponia andersonii TaxID=3476 RepID=A0A2P5CTA8_PARAD|nr:hypothetical protein PanWU01x14_125870 [Parasponia andersonii]